MDMTELVGTHRHSPCCPLPPLLIFHAHNRSQQNVKALSIILTRLIASLSLMRKIDMGLLHTLTASTVYQAMYAQFDWCGTKPHINSKYCLCIIYLQEQIDIGLMHSLMADIVYHVCTV